VAAVTTSLPEQLGGVRNWDYRFCWLRDATITLQSLMYSGYVEEARAWRHWLLRAIAGDPVELQIMYGVAGERRLDEYIAEWLPGYDGNPVRIGNAAVDQFQLDVYGEVMDALHQARKAGLESDKPAWDLQQALMHFVENNWNTPDEGIWEVRGSSRHFTHSKLMAWVAADRAVKAVEQADMEGPVDRWRTVRDEIRHDIMSKGFDEKRNTFTQYYGSKELDAAMLMMPLVGFLPATDERIQGTVAAIEKELLQDGFVQRYTQEPGGNVDGLPPGEGAFLACTFWLAQNYALMGRRDEGREVFERLLGLCNDVGLLSEEYDTKAKRLVGNFPQAFSHVPLIDTARALSVDEGPKYPRQREKAATPVPGREEEEAPVA
jgi:GH15 family glucan-1,4-alpha-glucosidase